MFFGDKSGWWFQHISKIFVKLGIISPIFGMKIKNISNHDLVELIWPIFWKIWPIKWCRSTTQLWNDHMLQISSFQIIPSLGGSLYPPQPTPERVLVEPRHRETRRSVTPWVTRKANETRATDKKRRETYAEKNEVDFFFRRVWQVFFVCQKNVVVFFWRVLLWSMCLKRKKWRLLGRKFDGWDLAA